MLYHPTLKAFYFAKLQSIEICTIEMKFNLFVVVEFLFGILFTLCSAATPLVEDYLCHIYRQHSNNGYIDLRNEPDSLLATHCDFCVGYFNDNIFYAGCVRTNYSSSQFNDASRTVCIATSKKLDDHGNMLSCSEESRTCCCRGLECYDKMRSYFSDGNHVRGRERCLVSPMLPMSNNGTLSAKNVSAVQLTQSVPNNGYWRTSCGACKFTANQQKTDVVSKCVEPTDVSAECRHLVNFVGGKLACDDDKRECCCKGPTCFALFNAQLQGQKLPPTSLDEPYKNETSYPAFVIVLVVLFVLIVIGIIVIINALR